MTCGYRLPMEICGTQLSCPAGKLQRLPLHGNQQEGFCVQSREKIPPSAPVTDNAKFIPNSPQWQRAVTGAREHRGVAAYWRGDKVRAAHTWAHFPGKRLCIGARSLNLWWGN